MGNNTALLSCSTLENALNKCAAYPRCKNSRMMPLLCVHVLLSYLIVTDMGAINPFDVWTSCSWAKRYSMVALLAVILSLSKTMGFESSEYPFFRANKIGAVRFLVSSVAKHRLKIARTLSSFNSSGWKPFCRMTGFLLRNPISLPPSGARRAPVCSMISEPDPPGKGDFPGQIRPQNNILQFPVRFCIINILACTHINDTLREREE